MNIPFRVKLLTETAKAPEKANDGDLWDLFADDFTEINPNNLTHSSFIFDDGNAQINPQGRILVKTGIALELPKLYYIYEEFRRGYHRYPAKIATEKSWEFYNNFSDTIEYQLMAYAVADIRPRSGLALKHGITILNSPATIDNSYRKEIGVILYNAGHEPFSLTKGMKIAQMLIRPLYPSSFEIVKDFEDTGRGGYGSTGY